MQINFDPTVSLGTVGSTLVTLVSIGYAIYRISGWTTKINLFMEESKKDRTQLREILVAQNLTMETEQQRGIERHTENVGRFNRIYRKLFGLDVDEHPND